MSTRFGTFLKPFRADSLWNSKPINPVLGSYVIPPCFKPRGSIYKCFPAIGGGAWSTGIYKTQPTDGPMTVYKVDGYPGILDTDTLEQKAFITLPHWPADATGATGSDGHCDIIDEEAGVIHSFWILKKNAAGQFTARQYSWSPLYGTGFGDAAHYSQGARATGVATCAGMIRKHEVNDGKPLFEHALACSMDYTGLSANPPFIPPATMSDGDYGYNTGSIPEGALIMLPQGYDTTRLNRWPLAKKVAETLKVYGARVVDRNEFTPYSIYVENGAGWKMSALSWDNDLANELEYIRTQLRQVISEDGFIAGEEYEPSENILSLRGPWNKAGSTVLEPLYDTLEQGLRIPACRDKTWYTNTNGTGFRLAAFQPKAGEFYRLTYSATNNSYFRMVVKGFEANSSARIPDITVAPPGPGQYAYVKWPRGGWQELTAVAVAGDIPGVLTASFEKIGEADYFAAIV